MRRPEELSEQFTVDPHPEDTSRLFIQVHDCNDLDTLAHAYQAYTSMMRNEGQDPSEFENQLATGMSDWRGADLEVRPDTAEQMQKILRAYVGDTMRVVGWLWSRPGEVDNSERIRVRAIRGARAAVM